MNILAIDTISALCSVALYSNGITEQIITDETNAHSRVVLPLIDKLLTNAEISLDDLNGVAFDRGPGSFTGLRIGAGVAQGLSFSKNIPLCGISSLQALACRYEGEIVVALDARMNQVYTANYSIAEGVILRSSEEQLLNPAELTLHEDSIPVGNGWDVYADIINIKHELLSVFDGSRIPVAKDILHLSLSYFNEIKMHDCSQQISQGHPVYIRNNVTG